MTKVARFESYRGFLFGSLNPDVSTLAEHLGDTTKVIDMLVDQSPEGLEVLRGASTYTYDGNWKVQAENGADGYHVTATHWNYAATTSRRTTGESKNDTKALDAGGWGKSGGGEPPRVHGESVVPAGRGGVWAVVVVSYSVGGVSSHQECSRRLTSRPTPGWRTRRARGFARGRGGGSARS